MLNSLVPGTKLCYRSLNYSLRFNVLHPKNKIERQKTQMVYFS